MEAQEKTEMTQNEYNQRKPQTIRYNPATHQIKVVKKQAKSPLSDKDKRDLCWLYMHGQTTSAIARHYKISMYTVRSIVSHIRDEDRHSITDLINIYCASDKVDQEG